MQTDLNDKPKILTSYYLEEEGIKEMAKGANDLALAVGSTYGPSGNTVMIYGISDMKVPFGTKDGVTVAKNMKDPEGERARDAAYIDEVERIVRG